MPQDKTVILIEIDEVSAIILNKDTLGKHLCFCIYQACSAQFGEDILQGDYW